MKSNFLKLMVVILGSLLTACASTHPGKMARSQGPELPVKVSAKKINEFKDQGFEVFEVTIENTSTKWVRLDKTEVLFEPSESDLSVVVGKDLNAWTDAVAQKEKQAEHNRKIAKLAVVGTGLALTIAGGASRNNSLMNTGQLVTLGGYGWVATDAVNKSIKKAESPDALPENYLYVPSSIPSKMFVRRWVVLNNPSNKKMTALKMQFQTVEGDRGVYAVQL